MNTESRWFERVALTTVFAMASLAAWAQDPPAGEPKEQEPEAAPVKNNWVTFGTYSWDFSGNQGMFRRYANGMGVYSLEELRLFSPENGSNPFARFTLRGSLWDDTASEALMIFDRGRGSIRGSYSKFDFQEASEFPNEASNDRNYNAEVRYAINPKVGAFWRYDAADHNNYLEAPKDPYLYRTKSFSGGISGQFLGGNGGVTWVDRRYYDREGIQPDSTQRQFSAYYGIDLSSAFNFGGAYSDVKISQRGGLDARIKNWALNATWDLGPDTSIYADTKRTDYDIPVTQNSYVQEMFQTSVRFVQHFGPASLQLGYRHKESERIRADHFYIDVPKWDTYEGRLTTPIFGGLRLTAGGTWEHLTDGASMLTEDNRQLYWDDRVKAQLRIQGGNDRLAGYAAYNYRFDQNSGRDIEILSHTLTLGASYVFNERASGYLEYVNDTMQARGLSEDGFSLDAFFPSSISVAMGFDYLLNDRETLSVGMSHYYTRNENPIRIDGGNIKGTEFTATYNRQLGPNSSLAIVFAPWRYSDRVNDQLSYRVTVLGINYTVKF